MCNVCVGIHLIDGEQFESKSIFNGNLYGIKGTSLSEKPEGHPCSYHLAKNGKWTDLINTEGDTDEDLADIVANGGFDVNDDARTKEQDTWIEKHFAN